MSTLAMSPNENERLKLEILNGHSSGRALFDSAITINGLDAYIADLVKKLTGGGQTPTTQKPDTIQDFPIEVK